MNKLNEWINEAISSKLLYQHKKLIVLANTRKNTKIIDGFKINFANEIEFFSENEFKEITHYIRKLNFNTTNIFNEIEFIEQYISKYKDDEIIVFNLARNGIKEGKKSLIPSFCDLLNIAYTGSNAFTISLCRNKYIYSMFLVNFIPEHIPKTYKISCKIQNFNFPKFGKFIVKPIAESGSIGVSNVLDFSKYQDLAKINHINNQPMLLQQYLNGDEYEVPIIEKNGEYIALNPVLISSTESFLSEKISKDNNFIYVKSKLTKEDNEKLKQISIKIASLLGIKSYGRIDYKFNEKNFYLIDIACSPYLTEHSSFYYNFIDLGIPYEHLFLLLIYHSVINQRTVDPKEENLDS